MRSLKPKWTAACIHDAATLLPSPTQATVRPVIGPRGFFEGHDVGHDLAGVAAVGQAVDDGYRGVRGEFDQRVVAVGADHDGVDVARQHARGIGDGLAAAKLQVGVIEH